MLRKFCLAVIAMAVLVPSFCRPDGDDIIAKNIQPPAAEWTNQERKSHPNHGHDDHGAGNGSARIMVQKRPEMARLEFTIQGLTAVQAYDGSKAWQIMPFMGKKDPELMSGDETKEMEETADLDGPLVDYKAKGNTVELLGKEKIEGTDAYKLKVTLKNGDVQTQYIDADSYPGD